MADKQDEIKNLKNASKSRNGAIKFALTFHPYQQVKDHRTNMVSHQPDKVLNGDLRKVYRAELDVY